MKRSVAIGVGLLMALATVGASARQQSSPGASQCSMTSVGTFDIGYVAEHDDRHYRCLATLDRDLKPSSAAWVEVVRDNRFVVKD
jgi:hypothetical protein